jgi:outer membrane protein, heavy metal efflux system
MKHIPLILVMWFSAWPALAQAQSTHPLTGVASRAPLKLEDFLAMADHNNPTLRQAEAAIQQTEAQARQASLYPNPTIGYEGEQIRGGSYGGGEQGGFVQQTVVLGGKLGLRRDVYLRQKQVDETAAQAQILRVHGNVTQLYYQALSAQEMVSLRERLSKLAQDAVETAHQLANVGQADSPDVLQTEVEAEQAEIDFSEAQRKYLEKFSMLAAVAGNPSLAVAPLAAKLDAPPEMDAEAMVTRVVEQSPALKQAQQGVAVAEARLKQTRREVVPDLQLRAGEQQNLEALSEAPGKKTGAQSFASVGIELPLWNRNQGSVRSAEAGLELARQEVTRTELSLRQQAEALSQNYLAARSRSERYRSALLPRARRAYELSLDKYQNMAQAYPQVLVAQRTLFELETHYIDSLDQTWQNAIALENFILLDGLNKPAISQ